MWTVRCLSHADGPVGEAGNLDDIKGLEVMSGLKIKTFKVFSSVVANGSE